MTGFPSSSGNRELRMDALIMVLRPEHLCFYALEGKLPSALN